MPVQDPLMHNSLTAQLQPSSAHAYGDTLSTPNTSSATDIDPKVLSRCFHSRAILALLEMKLTDYAQIRNHSGIILQFDSRFAHG
jgi:hypothetical protein